MALFRSPTIAWLGDLFEPQDRSKANGVINMMGGVGSLLAFFAGGFLFNQFGRSAPFVGGAVTMVVALIVVLLVVKEPRELASDLASVEKESSKGVLANLRIVFSHQDRSGFYVLLAILLWFIAYSALDAALSSFAVFTLGMKPGTASIYAGAMAVSFIVFAIPAGIVANRFGRRRVIQAGLVGLIVLTALGYFLIQNAITFVIILVLAGASWAMVNVNSLPLVYDHGDERKIGAYTGLYYFSSQSAAVIGPTLAGILVEAMGNQYRWVWLFGALFMALAWLAMGGVKARQAAK
jgi:MFS family permease